MFRRIARNRAISASAIWIAFPARSYWAMVARSVAALSCVEGYMSESG
jgi:hypothetical protein